MPVYTQDSLQSVAAVKRTGSIFIRPVNAIPVMKNMIGNTIDSCRRV